MINKKRNKPQFPLLFFWLLTRKRPWEIRLVDWKSASGIALWSTKMTHKGIHMLCKAELQTDNCIACCFSNMFNLLIIKDDLFCFYIKTEQQKVKHIKENTKGEMPKITRVFTL
jgi:hypothetical protein